MADIATVGLLAEDTAQLRFLSPMVERVAADLGTEAKLNVVSARGGIPTMRAALSFHMEQAAKGRIEADDVLLVAQDANRRGFSAISRELRDILEAGGYYGTTVLAVPDPYIEAWYLADPQSLQTLTSSARALRTPQRGSRDRRYKDELSAIIAELSGDATANDDEFTLQIVSAMNLYRAGRNVPSLGSFINELRSALSRFA